jgi:hypothetical protein
MPRRRNIEGRLNELSNLSSEKKGKQGEHSFGAVVLGRNLILSSFIRTLKLVLSLKKR